MKITQIWIIVLVILTVTGFAAYNYLDGFPVGFGKGKLIIRQYYCSDICPDYGWWHNEYYGINTKELCEQIGGYPLIDHAFRTYMGCSPTGSNY